LQAALRRPRGSARANVLDAAVSQAFLPGGKLHESRLN